MTASALRRRLLLPLAVTVFATLALHARCQAAPVTTADPRAPRAVTVTNDSEDKAGSTLLVEWKAPTAPPGEGKELVGYQVSVAEEGKDFQPESPLPSKATDSKAKDLYPGRSYRIKVAALYAEPGSPWIAPGAEAPKPEPGKP
ncbi:fibronectin type III domain-containing protein, partial [bacterium]|nr:fibronectin type III domain-containing protein [bacterium]